VARPWDITGDDLVRWSQQYDAPGVLPDLVRRLLLATTPISLITMNAHAGTRLRDWDGVVRSSAETAFCTAGISVWELTVEADAGKLSADLKKRSAEKGPFEPADGGNRPPQRDGGRSGRATAPRGGGRVTRGWTGPGSSGSVAPDSR
jgi:hypothetical protein